MVDGTQKQVFWGHRQAPSVSFSLPFHNNFGDRYAVVVSADHYRQAGFHPLHVRKDVETKLDLMLVPKHVRFNFDRAGWGELGQSHPKVRNLLAAGIDDTAAAEHRYNQMMDEQPEALACFFNVTTAMAQARLPQDTPLEYLKELIWGAQTIKRDRFFAYADKELLNQVKLAAAAGRFSREPFPGCFPSGGHGELQTK